ncbi:MAG: hypothetical protein JWR12_1994 [Mucilaginibacter sp.]|nr:hypothetical protein [Mucilaginibacter sp.]
MIKQHLLFERIYFRKQYTFIQRIVPKLLQVNQGKRIKNMLFFV